MKFKSLMRIALSIVLTFVLMLVVVPSDIASADLINNDVQSNSIESQFNTEKTEIVVNSRDLGERTVATDETLKDGYKNTGCLALAEGQSATAIELGGNELQCAYKNQHCDRCDHGTSNCTYRKSGKICKPC